MKRSTLPLVLGVYGLVWMWHRPSRLQVVRKAKDLVAGALIGHHALDGDAEACVIGDGA